jgi:AraC family transcriptional regulator, transcriptional activator of pobA
MVEFVATSAADVSAHADAFSIRPFVLSGTSAAPQRSARYGIRWILNGTGTCRVDFRAHSFGPDTLIFLTPYQPFVFQAAALAAAESADSAAVSGVLIEFTPEFFCIERHRAEVGCSGVLFNTLYDTPVLALDAPGAAILNLALDQLRAELARGGLAQEDALMALLKLFLIQATRLKLGQYQTETDLPVAAPVPTAPTASRLPDLLEHHFRTHKTAHDYAGLLGITAKALGRVVQRHFGRSVSELIQERVLMEAKRELFLTDAPVKAVAYGLGFDDPAHFSRYFRRGAGVSPEGYRRATRRR